MAADIGPVEVVPLIALAFALYMLPSYIAFRRHVHNRSAVLFINIVLGATLAGWAVAMFLATRRVRSA
ncbi:MULTISPECIES: superinfection immunity protein [unclassified Streptomyces]|uniref:superinfection immunity protein n=1 Tax=unclassified Streptomyces TaxID=2593676 RepID=UPI0038188707